MTGPRLHMTQSYGDAITVRADGVELFRYVYEPDNPQAESPHPYFHPIRTLGGTLVSLYRPYDHVWHKGLSLALPNVDDANFWGGPTYVRDKGYQRLSNNGTQKHVDFPATECTDDWAGFTERLAWITEQGEHRLDEERRVAVTVLEDSWRLSFATALHNRRSVPVRFGSPTTEGRPNAGYGGLFWRGPRSFNKGQILASDERSGPELMGERSEWLAYVGRHDGIDGSATIIFIDSSDNPRYPTKWFVRDEPYACISPAPFFDEVLELPPGETLRLRYDFVVVGEALEAKQIENLVTEQVRPHNLLG
jgi:hypothetical protein